MDEKKTYQSFPIQISSEEYRDLIIANEKAKNEASDYRSKYWEQQNKVKEAEKKTADAEATLASITAFFNSCTEARALYEAYVAKEALKASGSPYKI